MNPYMFFSYLLIVLLAPVYVFSECLSGDCINGHGIISYPDGAKYEGRLENSRYHGKGCLELPDGSTYAGQWRNGLKHGWGTQLLPEKDLAQNGRIPDYYRYTGVWKDGKRDGWGITTFRDHTKYIGQWQDDQENGNDILTDDHSMSLMQMLIIGGFYGGMLLLFISVLRQRLIERKSDKYKDVEI